MYTSIIWLSFYADINECNSAPCQNGGTCNNEIDGFTCDCRNGYGGVMCQTGMFTYGIIINYVMWCDIAWWHIVGCLSANILLAEKVSRDTQQSVICVWAHDIFVYYHLCLFVCFCD